MTNKRRRPSKILSMTTLNTIALVAISLCLLTTQIELHNLKNTVENNIKEDIKTSKFECNETAGTGGLVCEKVGVVPIDKDLLKKETLEKIYLDK